MDGQPPGEAAGAEYGGTVTIGPRRISHGAFGRLRRAHPAVLPIDRYHDIPQLLAVLDEVVVRPV